MMHFTNPILRKELRVSARTVKFPLSLMIYSLFMAGAGLVVMLIGSSWNYTVQYQFFTTAFPVLICVQMAMICLIMPVLTASSISGEREKQTLDIMLTTPVSSMTIMLGKLLASLGQLMLFLICGIPGMAVCFIYGGLNWIYLLQFLLQVIIMAFFIGSIGIWCSSLFRRTIAAIIVTMLVEAAFFLAPILLIIGAFLIRQNMVLRNLAVTAGAVTDLGMIPGVALLDPALGFIHSIVSVCFRSDAVTNLVLHGDLTLLQYRSSEALEGVFACWNRIYPVFTIGMGFLFLYLASRTIDQDRRENRRLTRRK